MKDDLLSGGLVADFSHHHPVDMCVLDYLHKCTLP